MNTIKQIQERNNHIRMIMAQGGYTYAQAAQFYYALRNIKI